MHSYRQTLNRKIHFLSRILTITTITIIIIITLTLTKSHHPVRNYPKCDFLIKDQTRSHNFYLERCSCPEGSIPSGKSIRTFAKIFTNGNNSTSNVTFSASLDSFHKTCDISRGSQNDGCLFCPYILHISSGCPLVRSRALPISLSYLPSCLLMLNPVRSTWPDGGLAKSSKRP